MGFFNKLFGGASAKPAQAESERKSAAPGSLLGKIKADEQRWNVTSLTNADPHYELGDIVIVHSDRDFYVDFPENLKPAVLAKNPNFIFHHDKSFDGFHYYSDIPMRSGIYDLVERIDKHRVLAAQEWLAESNGEYINRRRWGVLHINPYGTTGRAGHNALELQMYETDEFTHRVFRSIFRELQAGDPDMLKMKTATEVNRYNAFLTDIKVHTWVTVSSAQGEQLVFGQRGKLDVTLCDELSDADRIEGTLKFSFANWLTRCLAKELVINQDALAGLEGNIKGYDLFLDKSDYTIGLTAGISLDQGRASVVQPLASQGRVVPCTKPELGRMMQQGMTATGEYALQALAARNGIDLR
ncbi:hypothetical protein H1S01_06425 [Heliobacterium chlorum]|uniref:Uncharacterized protein n=1 Tax=Heliobacterium chlorum TaxID=2698 RepID=A0ABR7T030_HELCL|nr:hypothetical protein [Heliobacterium chlorum]MBC9784145.1 hypothetical protein [Heliobacterium chlorum]